MDLFMNAVLIVGILLVLLGAWLWLIAPSMGKKPKELEELRKYDYAHRGLHNKEQGVPENSLPAFRLAAQCGFGMELDLQLTKDNRVVIHHDDRILRSCGVDRRISQLTWKELQQYRLFGTEEGIPLFSAMLRELDGRTPMIVELKGYNNPDTLCTLAMEELDRYKGLYCVESFDPRIVKWFKDNRPQIVRGQLMEHLTKGKDGLTAAQAFCGRNLMTNYLTRPHFEAYDFQYRNNPALKAARMLGMQEVSWTLRKEEDFKVAKAAGNLCIFEGILPVEADEKKFGGSFEEILKKSRCTAAATEPK